MTDSLPPVISVVGYAKSGKTTFICSLVSAAVVAGIRVAVIKTGRAGHADSSGAPGVNGPTTHPDVNARRPDTTPDSARFVEAGAAASVFWSEQGVLAGNKLHPPPLPGRSAFRDRWYALLPEPVTWELQRCDLVIIEGRLARGARTVHLVGRHGQKYPVHADDLIVRTAEETAMVIKRLMLQGGNDVR